MKNQNKDLYKEYLKILQNDEGNSAQDQQTDFYIEHFKVPKQRQLELIAHSCVVYGDVLESKYENLYLPLLELVKHCKTNEETVILIYNFGRAIGTQFDSMTFKDREQAFDEEEDEKP